MGKWGENSSAEILTGGSDWRWRKLGNFPYQPSVGMRPGKEEAKTKNGLGKR